MILIVSKYLIPKGYRGFAVYPFVFIGTKASKADLVLLNHEKIHLKQQLELLILPFFVWYGIEFVIGCVKYKNRNLAYRAISFEREAYHNERNLDYLKHRPNYNFINKLTVK